MTVSTTTSQIITSGSASASSYADSSVVDASAAVGLLFDVGLTFGAATDGATVEVYVGNTDSFSIGTNQEPIVSRDITLVASSAVEVPIVAPHQAKYYKLRVVNNDDSVAISAINVYCHLKTA